MAVTPITITENFFYQGGTRWSPKGVCYQPVDNVDPISDDNFDTIQALLSASNPASFVNLNVNAIRVYQVDPTKPHKKVMDAFADAGIYVLVGAVNSTVNVISSTAAEYDARIKAVADAFCTFPNLLGLSISNEAINPGQDGTNPGYDIPGKVKAAATSLRAHMTTQHASNSQYRVVPVTCAVRDDPAYTIPAAKAYMCGSPSERMDFLGYNLERWAAGPESAKIGAYYQFCESFFDCHPVPIVLTEFDVSTNTLCPRDYNQVPYLYGQHNVQPPSGATAVNMADIVSGGFAFRYLERNAGWGLVTATAMTDCKGHAVAGPTGMTGPAQYVKIPHAGFDHLAANYAGVTGFAGTPSGGTGVACKGLTGNPYAGNGPPPSGQITITVKNTVDKELKAVQDEVQLATLPAGSESAPSSTSVQVDSGKKLYILEPTGSWPCVCSRPANTLTAGQTVTAQWMGDDCGECP